MDSIFVKSPKTLFLAHFDPLLSKNGEIGFFPKNRIFPEKSGSVTYLRLWIPNFMQKIRKKS